MLTKLLLPGTLLAVGLHVHDYIYTNRLITSSLAVFNASVKNMRKAVALIPLLARGGASIAK